MTTSDPMTTETAEMFMRQRDEAWVEIVRLRSALAAIAEGSWNVGAPLNLNFREFARKALDAS